MLAIVCAVEVSVARREDLEDEHATCWAEASRAATAEATSADVLLFGDSLVQYGIQPRALERRLGLRAYNLAVPAGSPESSYYLLRRALDAGARPKALVVDYPHFQLRRVPHLEAIRRRYFPELATPGEAIDLALARRDPGVVADVALGRALPSHRSAHEIRAGVVAALRGRDRSRERNPASATLANLRANRGALEIPDVPRVADADPPAPDPSTARPDPGKVAFVDRFLRLAASRGIPVFLVVPPISPEHQGAAESGGTDAALTRFLLDRSARHGNLYVLDARRSSYPPSLFRDPIHLSRTGASALTADLADLIASASPSAPIRWADLPRYGVRR